MKKIIIFFAVGAVIAGGTIYGKNLSNKQKQLSTAVLKPTMLPVSQQISTDTNKSPIQSTQVKKGETALALLQKTNRIEMSGEGTSAFVTAINGRQADKAKHEFWALYVNGKQAQVGAGSYILHAHDSIEWKIETY